MGGTLFGLSAALFGGSPSGRPGGQGNYDSYRVCLAHTRRRCIVHLLPNGDAPEGVGGKAAFHRPRLARAVRGQRPASAACPLACRLGLVADRLIAASPAMAAAAPLRCHRSDRPAQWRPSAPGAGPTPAFMAFHLLTPRMAGILRAHAARQLAGLSPVDAGAGTAGISDGGRRSWTCRGPRWRGWRTQIPTPAAALCQRGSMPRSHDALPLLLYLRHGGGFTIGGIEDA